MITEPVAAAHILKVDQKTRTVTVEVNIISPAQLGGSRCEQEALKAAAALRRIHGECVQNGCKYIGVTEVYMVTVLATFTGTAEEGGHSIGTGFSVYADDRYLPYAVAFRAEQVRKNEPQYAMGERTPVGISRGSWVWQLEVEERIPDAYAQIGQEAEPVTVKTVRDGFVETYTGCVWDSIWHEYSAQGMHRVRKGMAVGKEAKIGG